MTRQDLTVFYEKRKSSFSESLKSITKRINAVSNVRVAVALIFLALVYFGFKHYDLFYALPLVLLIFVLLVRSHSSLFENKVHLEHLKRIQEDELRTLSGDFSDNSAGAEFIEPRHPYTHDLDIFGEGSLFQYLNRAATTDGKKLLAAWLSARSAASQEIKDRQDAIRELSGKSEFRQEIQALGRQIQEYPDDRWQLEQWLTQPAFIFGRPFYRFILQFLPATTLVLVLTALIVDGMTGYAVLAALLQWGFLGFHVKRVNAFHQYIGRKKNALEKYSRILSSISNETYSSAIMQSLAGRAKEAGQKVRQLAGLVSTFDARMNAMTNFVANSLLLFDLQCVYRIERWKEENGAHLPVWLDAVTQTEALCSLGTFSFNHSAFTFPDINAAQQLSAMEMGHPLLDENERICNDVYLDREQPIMIITGANMAGKSTFLRSLGVNVVLALSGAPVCAKKFNCPMIDLRSGMRTADSLRENQSYFYAELYRLKSIMDELRKGTPLLVLLDEILKGTNSTDKQAGSIALVRQLVEQSCLTLIATHDLGLGELEKVYPGRVSNYCFEANIENNQLSFDYKLKPGLAQKMNATFLMRKMGIIPLPASPEGEGKSAERT